MAGSLALSLSLPLALGLSLARPLSRGLGVALPLPLGWALARSLALGLTLTAALALGLTLATALALALSLASPPVSGLTLPATGRGLGTRLGSLTPALAATPAWGWTLVPGGGRHRRLAGSGLIGLLAGSLAHVVRLCPLPGRLAPLATTPGPA